MQKYYKSIFEDFLDENFHKSLIVVIAEVLYVSLNVTYIDFATLTNFSGLDIFDIWNALNIFISFEQKAPRQLRMHLLELEDQMVNK